MNDPRPDQRHADALRRWLFPWKLPSAPAAQAASAALVARMTAQHPERFSAAALRQRSAHRAHHLILGALLSILTALLVPTSWTWAAPVAPTFFRMGCGCLLPTITFWRAAKAVVVCPLSQLRPALRCS